MNFRKPSKKLEYLITAIAVVPALYWTFTESGPFRAMMALEKDRLGFSSDRLTALLLGLAIYLPLRLVVAVRTDDRVRDPTSPEPVLAKTESAQKSALIAFGAAGCLAALAIFTYFHNVPHGPPVKATAADFAAGRVHDGEYLELAAATAGNALRLKRSGDERLYIPLAEAPVVVSIDAGDKDKVWVDDVVHVHGIVSRDVGNLLRDDLRSVGIPVADSAWLVVQKKDVGFDRNLMLAMIAFALVLGPFAYKMRRRAYAVATRELPR